MVEPQTYSELLQVGIYLELLRKIEPTYDYLAQLRIITQLDNLGIS